MGTLVGYDATEDLYKIQYEDDDVEELTWTDLNRLLRTSGDSITAPDARPPTYVESPTSMSPTTAVASLQKIRAVGVYGLLSGHQSRNKVWDQRETHGEGRPACSDTDTIMGLTITANQARSPTIQALSPAGSTTSSRISPRQFLSSPSILGLSPARSTTSNRKSPRQHPTRRPGDVLCCLTVRGV